MPPFGMTATDMVLKYAQRLTTDTQEAATPVKLITAEQRLQQLVNQDETPVNILDFIQAGWGPAMKPFPIQRLILKAIYKLPLDNTVRDIKIWDRTRTTLLGEMTEVEFMAYLKQEGRTNVTQADIEDPKKPFPVIVMVIGRRGTKTTTCGWVASYEAYKLLRLKNPQEYFNIAQHQDIGILSVSTGKDHATELFQGMASMVENSTFFKPYRMASLKRSIQLTTRHNLEANLTNRVGVSMRAAACSAKGLRGPQRIVVILDEYGHFSVELAGQNRSDKSVWKAVRPSTSNLKLPDGLPAGKIMAISTPLTRDSHLHELKTLAMDGVPGYLYFNIPSYWINEGLSTYDLEQELSSDEDGFMQEYGAEFTDRVSAAFRHVDLQSEARTGPTISVRRNWLTFMGLDLGGMGQGKTDGCAWHIVHYEGERKVSTYHEYRDPERHPEEFPLKIEDVADHTIKLFREYKVVFGIYDQWNGYGLQALLRDGGLREWTGKVSDTMYGTWMIHFTESLNSHLWKYVIDVAEAGQIITYGDELIQEIYQLQRTTIAKDKIRVKAPQLRYYHDDRADAWARALWAAKMYYDQNPGKLAMMTSNIVRPGRIPMRQRMQQALSRMTNPRHGNPTLAAKKELMQSVRPVKPRRMT